jgi:hypothetical protein
MAAKKKTQKNLYPVAIVPREPDILLDPAAFKKGRVVKLSTGVCANCGISDSDESSFRLGYGGSESVYCLNCDATYRVEQVVVERPDLWF